MDVKELARVSTLRLGTIGNCFVCVINGNPALESLDEMERLELEFIAEKKQIITLWIIQGPPGKIDMRIQARSKKLWDKVLFGLKGSAVVITSTGLGAVAVRTFLVGFLLLVPGKVQVRPFATVSEGVRWLLSLPGQGVDDKIAAEWVVAAERFARTSLEAPQRPAASG